MDLTAYFSPLSVAMFLSSKTLVKLGLSISPERFYRQKEADREAETVAE